MSCARPTRWSSLVVAVAAAGILSAAPARADNTLRWKFKQGESLNYVMDRKTDIKMDMSGSLIEAKSGMTFDMTWKVKSVAADGTAELEQTVDRIQMTMDSPLGGALNYDSKKPGSGEGPIWEMMGPVIESMVGGTVSLKASPTGEVTDIKLPEKVTAELEKQKTGGRRGMGMMGGMSEAAIKEMVTRSIVPLPEKPVTPELTWSQSFAEEMGGAGVKKTAVTYSASDKKAKDGHEIQKIDAKTELTFEPAENSQTDIEIEDQEGELAIYFDVDAGKTVKTEGRQKQTIAISLPNREIVQELDETVVVRQGKSDDGGDKKDEK